MAATLGGFFLAIAGVEFYTMSKKGECQPLLL